MILWLLKFPKNYFPRQMGFKKMEHADRIRKHFNLPKRALTLSYLEENEQRIPFTDSPKEKEEREIKERLEVWRKL